jgi:hypothetical protein
MSPLAREAFFFLGSFDLLDPQMNIGLAELGHNPSSLERIEN